MKKLLIATFLMSFGMISLAFASESTENTIQFFSCPADMSQRLRLFEGQDMAAVINKKDCTVVFETSIERAARAAEKTKTSLPIKGRLGLYVDKSSTIKKFRFFGESEPEIVPSVIILKKDQMLEVVEDIFSARQSGQSLSVYFMKHQAIFKQSGEPYTFMMFNLGNADISIEASAE